MNIVWGGWLFSRKKGEGEGEKRPTEQCSGNDAMRCGDKDGQGGVKIRLNPKEVG